MRHWFQTQVEAVLKVVILGASGNAGREMARLPAPTLTAGGEVVAGWWRVLGS